MSYTRSAMLPVLFSLLLSPAAAAAATVCATDVDALALGSLQYHPGSAAQDHWYATHLEPGQVIEVQDAVAVAGRAFRMLAPGALPYLQAEIKKDVSPPDLSAEPVVSLSFAFLGDSSDLSVMNSYEGLVQAVGGPHPGYTILAAKLFSGNGAVRSEVGLTLELGRFEPSIPGNESLQPEVGRNLAWNAWHTVTIVLDQAADRYVSVTVDGQTEDLSAYRPPRTWYEGDWLRGELIESVSLWTITSPWDDVTVDDSFHVDDLSLTTASADPEQLPPPDGQTAVAGDGRVDLAWESVADPGGYFDHYAVYRAQGDFTSVLGLTPLHAVDDRLVESWTDLGVTNGQDYWYAVTTVSTTGWEQTEVDAVGPVRPGQDQDLQVACIGRTPRFPRYDAQYTGYTVTEPSGFGPYVFSAATGLGSGQTEATPRWPDPGDPVTYTATVRNRGETAWNGVVTAEWREDGGLVAAPSRSLALAPGDTALFSLVRTWDDQLHDIVFRLTIADLRSGNNELFVGSKSVPFLSYVDETFLDRFRDDTANHPGATTDDAIDWLNAHMNRFNAMFAAAGTAKRVHYDVLEVLPDAAPDPSIDRQPFAVFPFRFRHDDCIYRNCSGYYDAGEDIDYGLLHEMGHQLGLIDLYRLDVGPDANQVTSSGYSGPAGLMNGCSHFISPHSADGMEHWLHAAHGYFGQYLYRLPEHVRLRLIGLDDQPLAGAVVTVYQKCERPSLGEVLTTQVKAQGITDAAGEWTLPNVELDPGLVPVTAAGDALPDNPFGYVAVIGTNGTLLLKIEHEGFTDHCWLDITEVNGAYHAGQTGTAIIERRPGLGGQVQYFPPTDLAEPDAGAWTCWTQEGAVSVVHDTERKVAGDASVRLETTGGFDTYARYPGAGLACWDLTEVEEIRLWVYAENDHAFQDNSPWLRLQSAGGYVELHPVTDQLNPAIGQWAELTAPLAGDALWQRSEFGAPDLSAVSSLDVHADTWDYGFTLWLDGVRFHPQPTTGVESPPAGGVLRLTGVRPNPFNPRAEISWEQPRAGRVRLRVHDACGRLVRTLADGEFPAGPHLAIWDGRDDARRELPSGLYFQRLEFGGEVRSGRMMLVR